MNARVNPQPGHSTLKIVLNKHGMQISIPVSKFKTEEKTIYDPTRK
jgi:hypothetical protein